MIPLIATVRIKPRRGRSIRLWLPLFLIWFLLVVLGVLLSPIIVIACLIAGLNPFTAVWGLIRVFLALAGTEIEIQAPDALVLVRVV